MYGHKLGDDAPALFLRQVVLVDYHIRSYMNSNIESTQSYFTNIDEAETKIIADFVAAGYESTKNTSPFEKMFIIVDYPLDKTKKQQTEGGGQKDGEAEEDLSDRSEDLSDRSRSL